MKNYRFGTNPEPTVPIISLVIASLTHDLTDIVCVFHWVLNWQSFD